MNKWLDEKWESSLAPYNDKEYAMGQLDELKCGVQSAMLNLTSVLGGISDGIDRVECGLTCGHSWQLAAFNADVYPLRKPPGTYTYKCVHCGEILMLQANKKKDWEQHIKLAEGADAA